MTDWINTIDPKGEYCPCCRRWAKLNKYKVTKANARTLIWMYRNTTVDEPFIDMIAAIRTGAPGSNFQNTKHWGLVTRLAPNEQNTTKHSGIWRLTDKGRAFVQGHVSVERFAYVFDDTAALMDGGDVTIHDCIDRFDYDEHMGII